MANRAVDAAGPVVEKFAGSAGRWLGYLAVAGCAAVVALLVLDDPAADWRGIALAVAVGLVSWAVLVRPTVAVHQHGVLIRNIAHDAFVPSSKIERCRSSQTLMIRAGAETFHGLGVGRSARSVMKEQRKGTPLAGLGGLGGMRSLSSSEPEHRFANEEQTGGNYADYVASRIEKLGHNPVDDDLVPIRVWAVESVVALVLAGGLVLAALLG